MQEDALFQLVRTGDRHGFIRAVSSANIQIRNEFRQNLLHEAIAFNEKEIADDLIQRGIDVNCQDAQGATPLHFAASRQDTKSIDLILSHGGDVHLADRHGNTPLWTAVFNAKGKYASVINLMQAGANPNLQNLHGRSALDFARQIKDLHLVKILERV